MPWLKLKNKKSIDLYFEFLDKNSKKRLYKDLLDGHAIKLPNFGGGIQNVAETLKWDELADVEKEILKTFLQVDNDSPKLFYDDEAHAYRKKERAESVIHSFLKLAGYDREKLVPGYKGKFVIHNHKAERAGQHFDLRLEFPVDSLHEALKTYEGKRLPGTPEPLKTFPDKPGTVFRSFAVRRHKLPTENTKLFIVETEDHPIAYGSFKGTIPEGYGAGDVDIYDKGTFEIVAVTGDKKYVLDFKGKELNGLYALVKYHKGYLWVKTKNLKKASALDYVRPTMPSDVWDLSTYPPQLKDSIRKTIFQTLAGQLEKGGLEHSMKAIYNLFISGSSTGFTYQEDGDLDIDIQIDFNTLRESNPKLNGYSDSEVKQAIQKTLDKNRNKTIAPDSQRTFSFMILDKGDFPGSEGVFDVFKKTWIKGPVKVPEDFDPDTAFEDQKLIAQTIIKETQDIINAIKHAVKDLYRIDQYIKNHDKISYKKVLLISRIKKLCNQLFIWRQYIWSLHDGAKDDSEANYPAFDFSTDWTEDYIIFKYIARYAGHEPVQSLFYELKDNPYLDMIKKLFPSEAVGRFFK